MSGKANVNIQIQEESTRRVKPGFYSFRIMGAGGRMGTRAEIAVVFNTSQTQLMLQITD